MPIVTADAPRPTEKKLLMFLKLSLSHGFGPFSEMPEHLEHLSQPWYYLEANFDNKPSLVYELLIPTVYSSKDSTLYIKHEGDINVINMA